MTHRFLEAFSVAELCNLYSSHSKFTKLNSEVLGFTNFSNPTLHFFNFCCTEESSTK
ncbi:hypothetical protein I79_013003 [Cricetulus griseus]|uniref:Uncharacterized protein n=1 Tax=Cricetulus griseus TaxID=10029 RepID=G3HQA6_CRIGR|nr:hypothetical protein I79_013003 [Cricetulus griseus]